jgi:hypothetical protein
MSDHEHLVANRPVADMAVHLFSREVAEAVGEADGPAHSLCGRVRSYGDFTAEVPPTEEVCDHCLHALGTDDE